MDKYLLADTPISLSAQDRFERYEFAKRIAHTLRECSDCLVMGINGEWGSGKTSTLNFIRQELSAYSPDMVCFTFNPWRFTDQGGLITAFFNALAENLNASFAVRQPVLLQEDNFLTKKKAQFETMWEKQKGPLKTDWEMVGDLIKEYGSKVTYILGWGEASMASMALGKALSNLDMEKLKRRIEQKLTDYQKKIVIFIDNLDQLEKNELQALFRLVKLTGDFAHTTYVLSFDQRRVAATLSNKSDEPGYQTGYEVLEKLVQVSVDLPPIAVNSLNTYTTHLINAALATADVRLEASEQRRFTSVFVRWILPHLKTPRQALRYSNALLFVIPLLKTEANLVDLMILEAIKLFYPNHYAFIQSNGPLLTCVEATANRRKLLADAINELSWSDSDKEVLEGLIGALFPHPEDQNNSISLIQAFTNAKRIAAWTCFDRYFTYSTHPGPLTGQVMQHLVTNLPLGCSPQLIQDCQICIRQGSPLAFIEKIRQVEAQLDWSSAAVLMQALSQTTESFSYNRHSPFDATNEKYQLVALFYELFQKPADPEQRLELATHLMQTADSLYFACELFNCLSQADPFSDKLFTEADIRQVALALKDRCLFEHTDKNLFILLNELPCGDQVSRMLIATWHATDPEQLSGYVSHLLESSSAYALSLLTAFVPTLYDPKLSCTHKGDFTESDYWFIQSVFDSDYLAGKVMEAFGKETEKEPAHFNQKSHTQSWLNLVRQFLYWHQTSISHLSEPAMQCKLGIGKADLSAL